MYLLLKVSLEEEEALLLLGYPHRKMNGFKKAFRAFPAALGSFFGAFLSFLGKIVGFVAEHTWALIVFVVQHIGI